MDERKQPVEALVGILLILGLAATGFLVVKFGKIQNRIQEHYDLVVEMSDATGIRKGVPVRLGGVLIGEVSGLPKLKQDFSALEVPLKIYREVKIPENSMVSVGAAGLMGDNYVKFALPARPSDQFIEPGTALKAGAPVGLKALQSDAEGILTNVNASVSDLNDAIESLERIFAKVEKILDDSTSSDLGSTISDLADMASAVKDASQRLDPLLDSADLTVKDFRETAAALKESSSKLDPLTVSADETISEIRSVARDARRVINSAGDSFESGKGAIEDIAAAAKQAEPTMVEIEAALREFRKTLILIDQFAIATEESDGLIRSLWDDPELKRDFIKLVDKLESNGVIFYPRDKNRERLSTTSQPGSKRP